MNLNHALIHARNLTRKQHPFRISFIKSGEEGRDSIKVIERCILRKADPKDQNREHKLFLFDADRMENRSCWLPLILDIDGHKVDLE